METIIRQTPYRWTKAKELLNIFLKKKQFQEGSVNIFKMTKGVADIKNEYAYSSVNQELTDKYKLEECIEEPIPKLGARHFQVFLYSLLCFFAFVFRVTLSVGIVAMTDPKTSSNPDIPTYPEWKDKNLILSAFFWGYMVPQIFSGWAANRFGAKWFLVSFFSLQSLLGILTPYTAAQFGSRGLMMSRAIQGFCQGFVFPSITHLLSQWVPTEERSRLATIVYAACPFATVITMLLTGIISASWYGWPMVFYLSGALGFVWVISMALFGYDSPAVHPSISKAEKLYIERSLGHTDEKAVHPTPWRSIITSGPVWALFITQTGNNYCFWTLLTQIPSYMNYVMNFNIKDNSLLSSLPYLTLWILSFVVGFTSDAVINKGILTRSTSRKLFNSIGLMGPAIALVILGYTRADQTTQAVALLIVAVGLNAAVFVGWSLNHLDLAPNHAGTLMGLCNGFSQSAGAIAPVVVQLVVTTETDPLQWRIVFFITAASNILSASVFNLFGTAEVQEWNEHEEKEKITEKI